MIKTFSPKFISPEKFDSFTYSKNKHFDLFKQCNYDEELFGTIVDPLNCDLKIYQDLFVYSFIKQNIKAGSRILDVGGGDSRILNYFKNDYECWNLDKLEGVGNGPTDIDISGFKLVYDYMGNFNQELPDNYFDLVFSISTLEHVPQDDPQCYENIMKDINRVLRPGGFSLHCIDVVWLGEMVWCNPIMEYFFNNEKLINNFIPPLTAVEDPEIFIMSEKYYSNNWQFVTGKTYIDFGKPFSYNFLWKKTEIEDNSF